MLFSGGEAKALKHALLLDRLVGGTEIGLEDPFWDALLRFPDNLSRLKPLSVEVSMRAQCKQLVGNNSSTWHLQKLLLHVMRRLDEGLHSEAGLGGAAVNQDTANGVYLVRVLLKYAVEHARPAALQELVGDPPEPPVPGSSLPPEGVLGGFVVVAIKFLALEKPSRWAYLVQAELLNALLVGCATQLTQPQPHSRAQQPLVEAVCAAGAAGWAPLLVQSLLKLFCARTPPPVALWLPPPPRSGLLQLIGASLLAPVHYAYYLLARPSAARSPPAPLADGAVLLLLVLVHYACGEPGEGPNPFREALHAAQDSVQYAAALATPRPPPPPGPPTAPPPGCAAVSFAALYDALGLTLVDDRATLLLYSLIHGNGAFLEYVLVRGDLDTLVLPLLEQLYHAPRRAPNQIYMLLIVLLILSQDASFNAAAHALVLPAVPWYQERLLRNATLGSAVVVMLIRTVKYNLSALRDVYLHTNCLAALANMAPHAANLSSYASQRLVGLFEMLAKKYQRLATQAAAAPALPAPAAFAPSADGEEAPSELQVYADFLRIVLEIINSVLTYALPKNPELVYALLHRQELFVPFRKHPRFGDLLDNIFAVLDYFNARMAAAPPPGGDWSVAAVLGVVRAHARGWRGDGLRLFTELRFTYEEEARPEEFFVPYCWSLVTAHSGLPWDPAAIALFPPADADAIARSQADADTGVLAHDDAVQRVRADDNV